MRPVSACLLALIALGVRGASQSRHPSPAASWENDPEIVQRLRQAEALWRAHRLAEAAAAYKRLLARAPNLAVAHLGLGLVRHDQRDYAGSTAEFARAASLDPTLAQAPLDLGVDAYLWGHDTLARTALEKAARWPAQAFQANYLLSLVEIRQGDLHAATQTMETTLQLRPTSGGPVYQSEVANLKHWRAILAGMTTAEHYVKVGRLEDAERECAQLLRQNPNLAGVHTVLGDIALHERQFNAALNDYRAEQKLEPQSPQIWFKIADTLLESRQFSAARQAALASLHLQPDFGPPYFVLGRVAASERRKNEAIIDFKEALRLGLDDDLATTAHYQLFRLLIASGRMREAKAQQAEYLRLQKARAQRDLAIARSERKLEESGLQR
jgi:tetratricopeptide (TPR) repeat protein